MKDMRIFSAWLGLLLCATVFLCPVLAYAQPEEASLQTYRGQVLSIEEAEDNPLSEAGYQTEALNVEVKILSGPFKQQTREIYHVTSGNPGYDIYVQPGDKVLLEAEVVDEQLGNVYIADHIRDTYVYGLCALFVVAVLLVGGKSGLKSLLSLVVIAILLLQVFLPLLLRGYQPLPLAMLVAALAILVTMFMVGGVSYKTLAAVIGTVGGVMLAGLLAYVFGQLAKLSGLSHTEAQMLFYIPQEVSFNYKGLLFAGMMIGALGAIMDVGMSIASAMFEVKNVRPEIGFWPLMRSGMNVGRDIMGTMTNTLILAYVGGGISVLLLFQAYGVPWERIMNLDAIATEVVRALAGSIGLVVTIPITALAAAWLAVKVGNQAISDTAAAD